MRVIGTAGHVDHGKSSLIEALTGTHPDRLQEEQARQMTIDLGFGWLTLPDGQEVGIVDVPGHRDFIENMLAGIAGIDAALLVVAVDEGVMPQTREHLAILDLLGIAKGVIVLTKADLITDTEWLDAVEADVRAAVKGTLLENAPIVRVSSRTRRGLGALTDVLGTILAAQDERADLGRARLPIDRVFSMSGFGTIVTGTLSDGSLAVGEDIRFLPGGAAGRIRGLQTHRKKVDVAVPGSRTAVNIAGISADQIRRGEVLVRPGQYESTRRLDARFHLLAGATSSMAHNREVKIFAGTSETTGVLRLLGVNELLPGQDGWIQLELRNPLVCVRGDSFILRRPSPAETLGGGRIVDAQPHARHKRFDAQVLASLDSLAQGSPTDVLFEAALALKATPIREAVARSRLPAESARTALHELIAAGRLLTIESGDATINSDALVVPLPHWSSLCEKAGRAAATYHGKFPLRRGIPREELKSRLNLAPRLFNAVLGRMVLEGSLIEAGSAVAMPGHVIKFDTEQQAKVDALLRAFRQNPYSPPSVKECQAVASEEVFNALILQGQLISVSAEVAFRKEDYDYMVARVQAVLNQTGQITLAEVRDLFRTSRRYAQALLEHLDSMGLTKRSGDIRVRMV